MQEYVAAILNLPIGNYYHIADNFHYYKRHQCRVQQIAMVSEWHDIPMDFCKTFHSIEDFDTLLNLLSVEEGKMRKPGYQQDNIFTDPFFDNWYKHLVNYNLSLQR